MSVLTHQVIDHNAAQTGQKIRKALRAAFPSVKFSLRMARGTGHGWFDLSWTDGPTEDDVQEIIAPFRSSYFDSTDDSTRSIEPTMYMDDHGQLTEYRYTCRGVLTQRHLSDEAVAQMDAYIEAHGGDAAINHTGIEGRDITRGVLARSWRFA